MTENKMKVTKDSTIGQVINEVPGAKAIVEKYFGNGCFTCAGINVESIGFGAMMHNLDPEVIIKEINDLEG